MADEEFTEVNIGFQYSTCETPEGGHLHLTIFNIPSGMAPRMVEFIRPHVDQAVVKFFTQLGAQAGDSAMTIIGSNKRQKPGARTATGWIRGFENAPEMTKREQHDLLADAVRNTAAIKPQEEKPNER